jgi:DNA (cytosine-5)-methyltransferase 1
MNPQAHKFPYKWYLKDGYPAKGIEAHNKTVFSTFSCGGGSSMGYKLAGFKVIGANDIDNQMRLVYITNHKPHYYVFGDIRKLLTKNYPDEFYNLDVLDGSPPCSTFSMAGSREDAWGKEKQFREGQTMQTLDDLFFDFIALAKKLQPKTIIAENVKGLISGNAKGYFVEIVEKFNAAGYFTQAFLLNGSTMGLPQKRERVFILCRRKDLVLQDIKMMFNEQMVPYREIEEGIIENFKRVLPCDAPYYDLIRPGGSIADVHPKGHRFNSIKMNPDAPVNTIAATHGACFFHYKQPRRLTDLELCRAGSFPEDYDFLTIDPQYLIGMSVPPVMMAHVSHQVYLQWLKNL